MNLRKQLLEHKEYIGNIGMQTNRSRLTILLSPVMLDSSISREQPGIKIPSAGIWRYVMDVRKFHVRKWKGKSNYLITNFKGYNITNNNIEY
jgi:hypothetical protein